MSSIISDRSSIWSNCADEAHIQYSTRNVATQIWFHFIISFLSRPHLPPQCVSAWKRADTVLTPLIKAPTRSMHLTYTRSCMSSRFLPSVDWVHQTTQLAWKLNGLRLITHHHTAVWSDWEHSVQKVWRCRLFITQIRIFIPFLFKENSYSKGELAD